MLCAKLLACHIRTSHTKGSLALIERVASQFELRSTSFSVVLHSAGSTPPSLGAPTSFFVVHGSCSSQAPIAPTSFSVVLHSASSTPPSLGAPTSYSVVHGSCSSQAPIAPTSYYVVLSCQCLTHRQLSHRLRVKKSRLLGDENKNLYMEEGVEREELI